MSENKNNKNKCIAKTAAGDKCLKSVFLKNLCYTHFQLWLDDDPNLKIQKDKKVE